jgi:hypothetical protein
MAKGKGQRAKGRRQKAEGRGQKAKGRNAFAYCFRFWALGFDRKVFIFAFCLLPKKGSKNQIPDFILPFSYFRTNYLLSSERSVRSFRSRQCSRGR